MVKTLANSGRFRAAAMNFCRFCARKSKPLPERSSSTKVTPPEVPTPGNGRRRKGEADGAGNLAQFAVQMRHDGLVLLLGFLALGPFLERDEEEAAVGVVDAAQHAVADDRGVILHARRVLEDLLRLPASTRRCAAARRRWAVAGRRTRSPGLHPAGSWWGSTCPACPVSTTAPDQQQQREARSCGSGTGTRPHSRRSPGQTIC